MNYNTEMEGKSVIWILKPKHNAPLIWILRPESKQFISQLEAGRHTLIFAILYTGGLYEDMEQRR